VHQLVKTQGLTRSKAPHTAKGPSSPTSVFCSSLSRCQQETTHRACIWHYFPKTESDCFVAQGFLRL